MKLFIKLASIESSVDSIDMDTAEQLRLGLGFRAQNIKCAVVFSDLLFLPAAFQAEGGTVEVKLLLYIALKLGEAHTVTIFLFHDHYEQRLLL